jgi:DNA-binding SARP family transcriptional activator
MILAALLLAAGRTVSIDRLAETVWEADPPQAAMKAVRNGVSSLRRRLADAGAPATVLQGP